jgi:hypothetical protein
LRHLIKLARLLITLKKKPKKLAQSPTQSHLKKHVNKKVPFGTFYFVARGARGLAGAFGLGVALDLGVVFGLATGAFTGLSVSCIESVISATGFNSAGVDASTLYGAAALISTSS